MKTVRIKGLVRIASYIRQELSGPLSAERRAVLQKRVRSALQQVDDIVKQAGATAESLAAPSRKAYQFLSTLDFDAINSSEAAPANNYPAGSIFFQGLRGYLQGLLDQFIPARKQEDLNKVYQNICSSSEHLEKQIRKGSMLPEQLTRETRQIRGWLAYFSQRDHFEDYVAALRTATGYFIAAAQSLSKLPNKVSIHFRPTQGLYRLRTCQNLLLVKLPTPMVSFDRETCETLAGLALHKNGRKQAIVEAMLSEPYQAVLCELELLGGIADNSKGIWHDLEKSFARINRAYFDGALARPRLVWSTIFTSSKFGHYDQIRDMVMISASLDRNDVPEFVVDFIMYHELLHKKLGVIWTNGRKSVHSADFSRQERQYVEYSQAELFLKKLTGKSSERHLSVYDEEPRKHTVTQIEYEDISIPRVTQPPRIGRNAPCPCGSGRKYKKCCGR